MDNNEKDVNLPETEGQEEIAAAEEAVEETVEEAAEAAEETAEEAKEELAMETPQIAPAAPKKPGKGAKLKRGGMATLLSVVFVAIIVVINILVGLLTERFPSMNIDLTADKLYSLSAQAERVAKGVQNETVIYLIGSEDTFLKEQHSYTSYGVQLTQVANLADKLAEVNPKISVQYIDPDANPTFIGQYADENLTAGCVMLWTEKHHRTLRVGDMFTVAQNQSYSSKLDTYSNADSALAEALELVNMDKIPVLTIATGHNEMLTNYISGFKSIMEDQSFEVREIDILTEDIPEDTQILMLPTPTTDYGRAEIDKLRAYMDNDTTKEDFVLLITADPQQGDLPNLNSFLEEWGLRPEEGYLIETNSSRMLAGSLSSVVVDVNTDILGEEKKYNRIVSTQTRPLTLLFEGNGDVSTYNVWKTADSAFAASADLQSMPENPVTGEQTAAAIAIKTVQFGTSYKRRSLMMFGSSYAFTDTFMNSAYGNSTYVRDLMNYGTGMDERQSTVSTKRVQTNVMDITATLNTVLFLGLGVFTIGIPVIIIIIGLVVFLKRRHL